MKLKAENRQEIKKNKSLGECLTNSGGSMQIYEAFDCPHCGCQNIMQVRKLTVRENEKIEEEADHDGCKECAHADLSWEEEPCKICKCQYKDYYTPKEEEK